MEMSTIGISMRVWMILVVSVIMTAVPCTGIKMIDIAMTDADTVEGLCEAQCQSWCYLVGEEQCENVCGGPGHRQQVQRNAKWLVSCSERDCVGTCSTLSTKSSGYVPQRPNVTITRDALTKAIILGWTLDPIATPNTIYVVSQLQQKADGGTSWVQLGWVRGEYYKISSIKDICVTPVFRVAAVNQFGSRWFSSSVRTPALIPGPPININLTVLEYIPTAPERETIYFGFEWQTPVGWPVSDIRTLHHVTYEPDCVQNGMLDVVYLFRDRFDQVKNTENKTVFRLTGRIPTYAIGCIINFKIYSISRCSKELVGAPLTYKLNLRCDEIPTYEGQYCRTPPVVNPGPVKDVKLTLIPIKSIILGLVSWRPPDRLGSAGRVESYYIFWGIMDFLDTGLIQDFKQMLGQITVPGSELEADIGMNVSSLGPFETLGVVVRAAGPGQIIDSPYGDINLASNRLAFPRLRSGNVLIDDGSVVVLQTNESTHVYWRRPKLNKEIKLYGAQWGEVQNRSQRNQPSDIDTRFKTKREDQTEFQLINTTFVSDEHIELHELLPNTTYGIKIIPLDDEDLENLSESSDWRNASLHLFTTLHVNVTDDGSLSPSPFVVEMTSLDNPEEEWLIPVIVSVTVVVLAVLIVLILLWIFRRRKTRHPTLTAAQSCDYRPYSFFTPGQSLDNSRPTHCPVVADEWELPVSCVKFGPVLGSGAFGTVMKGRVTRAMLEHRGVVSLITDEGECLQDGERLHATVAIKMLQSDCDNRYKQDFLKEIQLMKKIGQHANVVSILGCCTLRDPVCLIVEHVEHGDLLKYLKNVRHRLYSAVNQEPHYVNRDVEILNPLDLLNFALQITEGMDFLASKGFVHRDLAARNIMVGANKVCKIGDFGLARFVYDDAVYVNRRGGRLPVKWMSVEAIFDMSFSTASDVWSFGIVLFELVTLGGTPYPTIPTKDILKELQNGYRMERPDNCSEETYQMMLQCWRENPKDRPSFSSLSQWLQTMISDNSGLEYLDMSVNLDKAIYKNGEDDDDGEAISEVKSELAQSMLIGSSSGYISSHYSTSVSQLNIESGYRKAVSEDSGYTSHQKESVSSGEGQCAHVLDEFGDSKLSGSLRSPIKTAQLQIFAPDNITDDVFHDDNPSSNIPNLASVVTTASKLLKQNGSNFYEASNKTTHLTSKKLCRRHSASDVSRLTKDQSNVFSKDSKSPKRRHSDSSLFRHCQRSQGQNQFHARLLPFRKFSKLMVKAKLSNGKSMAYRQRRKAVVTPPTLALDNELYFLKGKLPRQHPPPIRISRRTHKLNSVTSPSQDADTSEGVFFLRARSKSKGEATKNALKPTSSSQHSNIYEKIISSPSFSPFRKRNRNLHTVMAEVHSAADFSEHKGVKQSKSAEPTTSMDFLEVPLIDPVSDDESYSTGPVRKTSRFKKKSPRPRSPFLSLDSDSARSERSERGAKKKIKSHKQLCKEPQLLDILQAKSQNNLQWSNDKDNHNPTQSIPSKQICSEQPLLDIDCLMRDWTKQNRLQRSLSEGIVKSEDIRQFPRIPKRFKHPSFFTDILGPSILLSKNVENCEKKEENSRTPKVHYRNSDSEYRDDSYFSTSYLLGRRFSDPSSVHATSSRTRRDSQLSPFLIASPSKPLISPESVAAERVTTCFHWPVPRKRKADVESLTANTTSRSKTVFANEKHPSALYQVDKTNSLSLGTSFKNNATIPL